MPLMTEIPEIGREPAARMVTSLRGLDRVLVAAHRHAIAIHRTRSLQHRVTVQPGNVDQRQVKRVAGSSGAPVLLFFF